MQSRKKAFVFERRLINVSWLFENMNVVCEVIELIGGLYWYIESSQFASNKLYYSSLPSPIQTDFEKSVLSLFMLSYLRFCALIYRPFLCYLWNFTGSTRTWAARNNRNVLHIYKKLLIFKSNYIISSVFYLLCLFARVNLFDGHFSFNFFVRSFIWILVDCILIG